MNMTVRVQSKINCSNKSLAGCSVHGCDSCLLPDSILRTGITNSKAMAQTEARKEKIRAEGFEVITVKSCEVAEQRKNDPQMNEFFKKALVGGPIAFREAFTGGRTHPMALHAKSDEFFEILYKDVVSLYPSVSCYFLDFFLF